MAFLGGISLLLYVTDECLPAACGAETCQNYDGKIILCVRYGNRLGQSYYVRL